MGGFARLCEFRLVYEMRYVCGDVLPLEITARHQDARLVERQVDESDLKSADPIQFAVHYLFYFLAPDRSFDHFEYIGQWFSATYGQNFSRNFN